MKTEYPLPPAPPTTAPATPAPKKRGLLSDLMTSVKVLLALAVIGGLLVWGAIAIGTAQRDDRTESSEVVTAPDPIAPLEPITPTMTRQEAMDAAVPILTQAAEELEQITATSAISDDTVHLGQAADLADQAAALFADVDAIQYGYLTSAAEHFRAAADAEEAYDGATFEAEMDAAAADLNAAADAI